MDTVEVSGREDKLDSKDHDRRPQLGLPLLAALPATLLALGVLLVWALWRFVDAVVIADDFLGLSIYRCAVLVALFLPLAVLPIWIVRTPRFLTFSTYRQLVLSLTLASIAIAVLTPFVSFALGA